MGKARALAALLLLSASSATRAAPEEIQVYLDDLVGTGNFGTDVHNNYVVSGSSTPDYPGAEAPEHVYRLTPEFYYGLSDTLELGLYVLTTRQPGRDPTFDGSKLRLKFIAPHDEQQGAFWGANLEIGDTSLRVSPQPWGTELKGIYGYRWSRWLFAFNTNLDWTGTAPFAGPASLDVDSKLAYLTDGGYQLGLESYNELGEFSHLGHLSEDSEVLYAVLDTDLGKSMDLNAGIGRGLTTASDRWVLKFILGFHF
ncbi:MAG TPA: hypothetical protein VGV16_00870 [Gammaproteobacteria bacterium]|nr:hypothetical protein [Gammaproteobacteria bacterium]